MKKLVLSINGNSPYNVLCKVILIVISVLAIYTLFRNDEIFSQVIDFGVPVSVGLWIFGGVTVVVFTVFINLLQLFLFEYFMNGRSTNILQKLWNHLKQHGLFFSLLCLDIFICCVLVVLYANMELEFSWSYFKVIISTSVLGACFIMFTDYDDVELSSSQSMEKSIGALMAYGAYSAFYKPVLLDITKRMSEFEEKHGTTLLVKKLVMICPLSCNANGSLEGKDGYIKLNGELTAIITDEGANNNRTLKTNVYQICVPSGPFIAAEIPSPLSTLYEMRESMDDAILQYHRKCFIETLRDLLKGCQCIILEYDDLNSTEELHSFLLSNLEDSKFVNVLK